MRIIFAVFLCGFLVTHCNEHRRPRAKTAGTDEGESDPVREGTRKQGREQKAARRVENAFPSQVSGGFYTANPDDLRRQVEGFLAPAKKTEELRDRDILGVLAPHAGYRFSGPIAGRAYGVLAGRGGVTTTVVVLALSHRQTAFKAAVLNRPAYDTPLGSAKIDRAIIGELVGNYSDLFEKTTEIFKGEHSFEVHVPFIQVALPKATIVPLIVAVQDESIVERIGEALYAVLGKRKDVAFVVSSDLSHFLSYEEANRLDNETLGLLESWNIPKWKVAAKRQSKGMCGFHPLLAFVAMFENYDAKSRRVSRLEYKNSGDTAGDPSRVVGYGALAFSLEKTMRTEELEKKDFGPFTGKERRYLMELAKESVRAAVSGRTWRPETPSEERLAAKGAAFVTLKKNDNLRGCIGHVVARVPLYQCVSDVARSAAIHDTRFGPVRDDELAGLSYEISVLTAPVPIKPEDVIIGKHGLIMTRGSRAGLLLPQVPVEWGWNREEFLAHTCGKAGLPLGCWKEPDTKIEGFQAIVFGEGDLDD